MLEGDLFLPFVDGLESLGLVYMLTGSVASTLYGEPRVTHDVDVVLEPPLRDPCFYSGVPARAVLLPPGRNRVAGGAP